MTDIPAILNHIRPGAEWALDGDSYDGLIWLDKSPKPTLAEIEAATDTVAQALADAESARVKAREDALKKLAKLGLTVDDITALTEPPQNTPY